jgi:hypothetical protein
VPAHVAYADHAHLDRFHRSFRSNLGRRQRGKGIQFCCGVIINAFARWAGPIFTSSIRGPFMLLITSKRKPPQQKASQGVVGLRLGQF